MRFSKTDTVFQARRMYGDNNPVTAEWSAICDDSGEPVEGSSAVECLERLMEAEPDLAQELETVYIAELRVAAITIAPEDLKF